MIDILRHRSSPQLQDKMDMSKAAIENQHNEEAEQRRLYNKDLDLHFSIKEYAKRLAALEAPSIRLEGGIYRKVFYPEYYINIMHPDRICKNAEDAYSANYRRSVPVPAITRSADAVIELFKPEGEIKIKRRDNVFQKPDHIKWITVLEDKDKNKKYTGFGFNLATSILLACLLKLEDEVGCRIQNTPDSHKNSNEFTL